MMSGESDVGCTTQPDAPIVFKPIFQPNNLPGGNADVGRLISDAMARVGRQGVVTMEESKTAEDNLVFVEGMQFDRGYYSPYFVTDPERMVG